MGLSLKIAVALVNFGRIGMIRLDTQEPVFIEAQPKTKVSNLIITIASIVLFVAVVGYFDSRVRWPKPNDKTPRYVSIAERSKSLRRD